MTLVTARQPRVAVDATTAARGGGLSYLARQLPELERAGAKLLVFAQSSARDELGPLLLAPDWIAVPSSRLRRIAFVHARLAAHARRWGADVLYCPGSTSPIVGGIPSVMTIQNPHLFAAPAPRTLRHALLRITAVLSALRASHVVHISGTMAQEFERTAPVAVPSSVIYSGAGGLEPTSDVGDNSFETQPYILAVSNLYRYKRMDLIIRAYAGDDELRGHYQLLIAGGEIDEGLPQELRDLADRLGQGARVRLLGSCSPSTLASLYRHASVYVSASEREAFPLTPAEALVARLPVVLSDIPVFRELYGEWALFPNGWTPQDFADAIKSALASGGQSEASAQVTDRFSWRRNGNELFKVLSSAKGRRVGLVAAAARVRPQRIPSFVRAVLGSRDLRSPAVLSDLVD